MQTKLITFLTLFFFVSIALFSPLPNLLQKVIAQNTGSLRLVTSAPSFSFKKDLMFGDTDPDVKELQKILNTSPDTTVSLGGPGSPGQESSYFGTLTKSAVIKFQEKYRSEILTPSGLTAGNGIVGRSTRTKLNLLLGVGETFASVGLPQSRASIGSVVTSVPPPQSTVSTCNFVELLINIGAISSNKADSARLAMNCSTVVAPVVAPPSQPSTNTCSFVNLLISIGAIPTDKASQARSAMGCATTLTESSFPTPMVTVKVNNSSSNLSLSSPRNVTFSWSSKNVTSCVGPDGSKSLSGSESIYIDRSQNFVISCTGPYGTVTDSVVVSLSPSSTNQLSVSCWANPASVEVGDSVTWSAVVSGGDGEYDYVWDGTSELSVNTQSITKSYQSTGLKEAQITITSGSETESADCTTTVYDNSNDSSPTPDSSLMSVDLQINMQDDYTDYPMSLDGNEYLVSWDSTGVDSCTVSSSPTVSGWNNGNKQVTGFEWVKVSGSTAFNITCRNASSSAQVTDRAMLNIDNSVATALAESGIDMSSFSPNSSVDQEAKDLDQVQILSEGLNCLSPLKNHAFVTYSFTHKRSEKYIWVMGESEFVDNIGGMMVGNLLDGGGREASYKPMYSIPITGQVLSLVLGEDIKCTAYGKSPKILRAYMTFQGQDWVKEQETKSTTGSF